MRWSRKGFGKISIEIQTYFNLLLLDQDGVYKERSQ